MGNIVLPPSTRAVIPVGNPGGTVKSGGNPGPTGAGGDDASVATYLTTTGSASRTAVTDLLLISHAENTTGTLTATSATPVAVPGTAILVPARTRPFRIDYRGLLTNAGQLSGSYGLLYLDLYEVTGGTPVNLDSLLAFTPTGTTAAQFGASVSGSMTFTSATTDRIFALYGHTFNFGTSTLGGGVYNSAPAGITSIRAVGL